MDKAAIQILHLIIHAAEVASGTTLVAQRPEDDTRVVAVALHHALHTVIHGVLPARVARYRRPCIVTFHVGLIHTVQTVGIEHGIHLGLTGIVARAHGVDIGLLHQLYIAEHGLQTDSTPCQRVGVLGVHTLEVHPLPVDENGIAALGDVAEAVTGRESHLLIATSIFLRDDDGIEIGLLAAPGLQAGKASERYGLCGSSSRCKRKRGRARSYLAIVIIEQLYIHGFGGRTAITVVHRQRHIERTGCGCRVGSSERDDVVAHKGLGGSHQVHIAVYARQVPHVLSLQIGTVAPAVHPYGDIVLARGHKTCQVKLGIGIGTL